MDGSTYDIGQELPPIHLPNDQQQCVEQTLTCAANQGGFSDVDDNLLTDEDICAKVCDPNDHHNSCPDGQFFDELTQQCQVDNSINSYPDGQFFDEQATECLTATCSMFSSDGVYNLNGESFYCDTTTDEGGWMLMATQTSLTGVYTNTSPLATDLNPETPSPDSQYSRNWSILIQDPQPGSEWLMKRGSSGDWVKFVQGGDKVWCGWDHIGNCNDPDGSQDEGGSERKDYKDQSFTMGKLFDQNGNDLNKPYFNGCGLAGGCRNSDADGIGFSATWHHNNGGFAAGSAWPPVFRWNGEEDTIDSNKTPYTIWYRPINDSSLWLD